MYNYQIGNIHITSMLDIRRANKEGNFPVKIRVTFQGDRKYYATGKYLSANEWESLPTAKNTEKIKIRGDIQTSFDNVKDEVEKLNKDSDFSFNNLNRLLKKGNCEIINIAFTTKIKELTENGQVGTAVSYKCALSSIESFAGKNIPFENVTVDWLMKYEKKLVDEKKSQTTIGFYTRCIRSVLNDAKKTGLIKLSQYPFGAKKYGLYDIKTGESRKLALTIDQIKEVVNYTDGLEGTERYRDLWYFSLLCNGANFTDILNLKYSDISNKEITFVRQKTVRTSKVEKKIMATLTPAMEKIIKKYGNPKNSNNYIFPYIKGNETPLERKNKVQDIVARTNKRLSKIGEALGIEGLTTYAARHSYANILLNGNAPIALIADQLGHTNISTTQSYLAGFGKDDRKKYSDLFSDL